jgi:trimeric autotransporter adhesin
LVGGAGARQPNPNIQFYDINTTGSNNTSNGDAALFSNTTGSNNTATGDGALLNNGTGSFNVALGAGAGSNHTTGSNNIYIGSGGAFSESRTIRIGDPSTHGRTFVAGISGATVPTGVAVIVDANGQLGTVVSSERFKDGIKADGQGERSHPSAQTGDLPPLWLRTWKR